MELTVQILGISAGILTSISSLPQVIKILKEKQAKDVSLFMLIVLITGLSLWIVYGLLKKDIPIIATNCFSMLLNLTLIVVKIIYGDK